mmetsp:Transcript_24841/g.42836  ORF Transcript_24841/g.42836 Transcript_24841/m.42836 type:complete len:241 (-) Transcript_24841:549-1271(-)
MCSVHSGRQIVHVPRQTRRGEQALSSATSRQAQSPFVQLCRQTMKRKGRAMHMQAGAGSQAQRPISQANGEGRVQGAGTRAERPSVQANEKSTGSFQCSVQQKQAGRGSISAGNPGRSMCRCVQAGRPRVPSCRQKQCRVANANEVWRLQVLPSAGAGAGRASIVHLHRHWVWRGQAEQCAACNWQGKHLCVHSRRRRGMEMVHSWGQTMLERPTTLESAVASQCRCRHAESLFVPLGRR